MYSRACQSILASLITIRDYIHSDTPYSMSSIEVIHEKKTQEVSSSISQPKVQELVPKETLKRECFSLLLYESKVCEGVSCYEVPGPTNVGIDMPTVLFCS